MPVSYGFAEYTTRARASDVALDSVGSCVFDRHASDRAGFSAKINAPQTRPYLAKTDFPDRIQRSRTTHSPSEERCSSRSPARGARPPFAARDTPRDRCGRHRGAGFPRRPRREGLPRPLRLGSARGAAARWRPPSSRSAARRRRVRASSRSASGLIKRRPNNKENAGARPSRPGPRI